MRRTRSTRASRNLDRNSSPAAPIGQARTLRPMLDARGHLSPFGSGASICPPDRRTTAKTLARALRRRWALNLLRTNLVAQIGTTGEQRTGPGQRCAHRRSDSVPRCARSISMNFPHLRPGCCCRRRRRHPSYGGEFTSRTNWWRRQGGGGGAVVSSGTRNEKVCPSAVQATASPLICNLCASRPPPREGRADAQRQQGRASHGKPATRLAGRLIG